MGKVERKSRGTMLEILKTKFKGQADMLELPQSRRSRESGTFLQGSCQLYQSLPSARFTQS